MSGERLSSSFFSALCEYSTTTDEPLNSEPRPSLANDECHEPRAENRKPSSDSSWRTKSTEEKPAPLTNWRDRSQPRNASSAFSTWRSGARREESKGALQPNDVCVRQTSNAREKSTNPFGERRSKFGWSFSPASNGSALSAVPGGARKAFGDSRNKFGSNSSIASDCSTSSWSVASESYKTVNGRGFGRGAPHARGNAVSVNNLKTDGRMKPTRQGTVGSSKLTFKYLDTLLQKKIHEIVLEVTIDKSPFDAYLQKSPLESDWLVLIMSIVAKVCVSDYEGNRSDLLYKLCKSSFFDNLSNYLGDVTIEPNPETVEKLPTFMHNLCEFYSSLLDAWPMMAVEKNLKKLITKTKVAVSNIPIYLGVTIDEDILSKLETFTDTFDEYKKILKEKQLVEKRMRSKVEKMANCAPPDDFRSMSLYPTAEDLFRTQRGFIRPNKIRGAYQNVEHYLDVQFRLLREDFVHSVRSGVQKYLASKSEPQRRYKFDNVRIYPDTRLESWKRMSSGSLEVGVRLNFDTRERFAWTCDWAHNKRFMFGSLLLLTTDDFNTFICATVLERDVASLRNGCVLAALVEEIPDDFHKVFAKPFIMAECEVFFEPYFLILQALKMLNERSFPMPQYIVRGQAETKPPSYPFKGEVDCLYHQYFYECNSTMLRRRYWDNDSDSDYDYAYHYDEDIDFVFDLAALRTDNASNDSFQLDMYQTEAYKAGMKRDFCVIQGPPGTGKTFLGLKLVASILKECKRNEKKLPILVVCLTNHALDQFLERILAFTNKIVRVGGQSRNDNLNSHNLRTLRYALWHMHRTRHHSSRKRRSLRYHCESMTSKIKKVIANFGTSIADLQKAKKYIETPVGVLSSMFLKQIVEPNFLPVVENDETLLQWLFEDNEYETPVENDVVNFCHLYENGTMDNEDSEPVTAKKVQKNPSISLNSIFEENYVRSYAVTLSELERELQSEKERYDFLVQTEGSYLEQGFDSNLIYFEKNYLKNKIKYLTRQYNKLKANLEMFVKNPEAKVVTAIHQDPTKLPSKLRWLVYWSWLSSLQKKLSSEITEFETLRHVKTIQYEEYQMFEDLYIMNQSDIVGMTTTGAARLQKLLASLKPAIGKTE